MEGMAHVTVPLRVGKKMRKRRELDALVAHGAGAACARGPRLLSASSDECEPWPRRVRPRNKHVHPAARACAALLVCVCVVATATVLWLFVDVRRQIVSLRHEMDRVSTSSDGVSDALQLCHSAAKELRANTSSLGERLAKLAAAHEALADNYTRTAAELKALQDKLAAAPELADTPRRLGELSQTVAEFGSRLGGFDESIKSAREAAQLAARGLDDLRLEFNATAVAANASAAERAAAAERMKALSEGIVGLNATIETRLRATEKRLNEYQVQLNSEAASLAELRARTTAAAPTLTTTTQKPLPNPIPSEAAPSAAPVPAAAPAPVAAPTAAATTSTSTPGATKPPILQSRA